MPKCISWKSQHIFAILKIDLNKQKNKNELKRVTDTYLPETNTNDYIK